MIKTAPLLALLVAAPAAADEARHLLYLSAEASFREDRLYQNNGIDGFGGIGWMFAPRGLDHSGPVIAIETGRPAAWEGNLTAISAGWRWQIDRFWLTAMAGAEQGERKRKPVTMSQGSLDLWWDDKGWMGSARVKATRDYTNWRVAGGRKFRDDGPFYGIEVASPGDDTLRAGFHSTGQKLPLGIETRVSGGWSDAGSYAELSVWRRF